MEKSTVEKKFAFARTTYTFGTHRMLQLTATGEDVRLVMVDTDRGTVINLYLPFDAVKELIEVLQQLLKELEPKKLEKSRVY